MTLDSLIEAILFFKGESTSIKKLAEITKKSAEDVKKALESLEKKMEGRGIQLIYKEDEVMLVSAKEAGEIIAELTRDELTRDLGKAGLETLTIILYKGPIARKDIDYIRGVNSNFILRNLTIRGLVEKITNERDQRSFLYKPTFELLQFLGIKKIDDLPQYRGVLKEIGDLKNAGEEDGFNRSQDQNE